VSRACAAAAGDKNPGHMHIHCRKSCEVCDRSTNKVLKGRSRKDAVNFV
jgi:hypothetical protein